MGMRGQGNGMAGMKRVGIQEFWEQASELLTENEVLTVERQGQAVGVYLPLSSSSDHNARDSLAALRAAVAAALANGQMTEDELADLFDLRRPLPPLNPRHAGQHTHVG